MSEISEIIKSCAKDIESAYDPTWQDEINIEDRIKQAIDEATAEKDAKIEEQLKPVKYLLDSTLGFFLSHECGTDIEGLVKMCLRMDANTEKDRDHIQHLCTVAWMWEGKFHQVKRENNALRKNNRKHAATIADQAKEIERLRKERTDTALDGYMLRGAEDKAEIERLKEQLEIIANTWINKNYHYENESGMIRLTLAEAANIAGVVFAFKKSYDKRSG